MGSDIMAALCGHFFGFLRHVCIIAALFFGTPFRVGADIARDFLIEGLYVPKPEPESE